MSQYFHYFAATADEAAAAVEDGPSSSGLVQTELKSVDPVVLLGQLVADVTGVEFSVDDRLAQYPDEEPTPAGHLLVQVVGGDVAVLAGISDESVAPLAAQWAQSEYWFGEEDPDALTEAVQDLRSVARAAVATGRALYAWALV